MAEYVATPKLRWVTSVDFQETGYDTFVKQTRTLQQWWAAIGYKHTGEAIEGVWRDVPVETENV